MKSLIKITVVCLSLLCLWGCGGSSEEQPAKQGQIPRREDRSQLDERHMNDEHLQEQCRFV